VSVEIGLRAEHELVVEPSMTAAALGNETVAALSTPMLVQHFEQAAVEALADHLDEGLVTVGVVVAIQHLAATPVGMRVRFSADLIEVHGPRLVFRVEAHDEAEKVGEGTHERFVVVGEKFAAGVSAKAASR
jgi:fluoroacetyl-CoA thioesterase